MSKKSVAKFTTLVFSVSLLFSIYALANHVVSNSPATPAQKTDCKQISDADLTKTLYDKIKADKDLSSILPQINFSVTDKKVIIEGWVAGKSRRKAIENLVKKTECVKKVKNDLKEYLNTGCAQGQKPCGEICIDRASTCTNGN